MELCNKISFASDNGRCFVCIECTDSKKMGVMFAVYYIYWLTMYDWDTNALLSLIFLAMGCDIMLIYDWKPEYHTVYFLMFAVSLKLQFSWNRWCMRWSFPRWHTRPRPSLNISPFSALLFCGIGGIQELKRAACAAPTCGVNLTLKWKKLGCEGCWARNTSSQTLISENNNYWFDRMIVQSARWRCSF